MAIFGPRGKLPDADLRSASLIDADDVAALLCELGYPCDARDAAQRISTIIGNERQALVVTTSAQGRGLGRQLLREAERRARAAGAARIELTSGSQRADAHAFYKACGYSDGTLRFIKRLGDA